MRSNGLDVGFDSAERALPQSANCREGAPKAREYESQGQARSEAKRVAPGKCATSFLALKERHYSLRSIRISHFQCSCVSSIYTRGDALRACPWLSYLRAFGAGTVWFRTFEARPCSVSRACHLWVLYLQKLI
jgi:hypothetical protein